MRSNQLKKKHPTSNVQYQTFEDPSHLSSASGASGRMGANCMGNGCRVRGVHAGASAGGAGHGGRSSSGSREDIPASEFMTGSGIDSYHSLSNTPSSVATIPMQSAPAAPPFRLRITEHSEERKRSFVRLSRKYRQALQNQSAQVCHSSSPISRPASAS